MVEDATGSTLGSSGEYRCRFCTSIGEWGHAGTSELASGDVAKARLEDDHTWQCMNHFGAMQTTQSTRKAFPYFSF